MRRARPSAICCKKICKDYDVGGFSDASSLIFSGRFQSLAVLRIAAFLEQRWNLDFAQGFEQSQLDSVEEMMNFLRSATLPRGIAADAIAADALQRYLAVLVPPVLVTHAAKQRLTWVTKSPNIKVQMATSAIPKRPTSAVITGVRTSITPPQRNRKRILIGSYWW